MEYEQQRRSLIVFLLICAHIDRNIRDPTVHIMKHCQNSKMSWLVHHLGPDRLTIGCTVMKQDEDD